MMKRLVLLTGLLALCVNTGLKAQSKEELRNNFFDAESWILFESYQDALPLYQQLLKSSPRNANYKYRIGQCYMNMPGEKARAISYLEDAVKNINPTYKEGKFTETGAPYDALYFLANAYRINNQLDKALKTYQEFRRNLNPAVYDTAVVNFQIQSCLNAKELMKMPLYVRLKNAGRVINTTNNEFNPVVSVKEDMIIYSRSLAFYDALLFSRKLNGNWTEPVNLNELLKVDRDLFPTSISSDGKELYLYNSAEYDGNIYTSRLVDGVWMPLVKLNDNINTKFWESHATISHDNKKLYFTSNRKGTLGGLDIYVSMRDSTGDWGPAINLGPTINTQYNEESPFLSADDKTLFFSSRGHYSMGGYDIFYSTLLDNGEWSKPINLGAPLNTTDDDVFFCPVNQGFEGYIARELPGGTGKQDIYRVELFSDRHPRRFYVKGFVSVADLINTYNDSVRISVTSVKRPGQPIVVYSDPKTGEYRVQLPQGEYTATYEGDGGEKVVKNFELPLLNPSDSVLLSQTVLPKTDFVADLAVGTGKTMSVIKGDSIVIPIKAEPRSNLIVEHWVGESLISVRKVYITDSVYNYKLAPANGKNRVVIKLTDRFNNTTQTEVVINREKDRIEQQTTEPEYNRTISGDQITSLANILKNRSSSGLSEVISSTPVEGKQFGKIDDYIQFLKNEAGSKGISAEEVDKAALRAAMMDNILTQSAVTYLAAHSTGEVSKVLSDLNIYDSKLRTWSDLQKYVEEKTGGRVNPEDLNSIAAAALAETDPAIPAYRKKVLDYSATSPEGNAIRETINTLDQKSIKSREEWINSFRTEALKHGLNEKQIADILVNMAGAENMSAEEFRKLLATASEEPLTSAINSIDLKKEGISTPSELLAYLLRNQSNFPGASIDRIISKIISDRESAGNQPTPVTGTGSSNYLWLIIVIIAAAVTGFFLWLGRKKKRQ